MDPSIFVALRTRFGMSKVELAACLKASRSSVQRWEIGTQEISSEVASMLLAWNVAYQREVEAERAKASLCQEAVITLSVAVAKEGHAGKLRASGLPYVAHAAVIGAVAGELLAQGRRVRIVEVPA